MFHHDKLKPYVAPQFPGQTERMIPPKPEFVDGEPKYEVAEVLGEKKKGKTTNFLVHWEGYSPEEDTWEPEENLMKAKEAIKAYQS